MKPGDTIPFGDKHVFVERVTTEWKMIPQRDHATILSEYRPQTRVRIEGHVVEPAT